MALESDDGTAISVRNVKKFRLSSMKDMSDMSLLLGDEMSGFHDAVLDYVRQNDLLYDKNDPVRISNVMNSDPLYYVLIL